MGIVALHSKTDATDLKPVRFVHVSLPQVQMEKGPVRSFCCGGPGGMAGTEGKW